MLTGEELGKALRAAMELKQVTQAQVAAEFGVTQPSVSEWLKYGRIGKKHLPHLVKYFSNKVGPSHWGLPEEWGTSLAPSEAIKAAARLYKRLPSLAGFALANAYDELPDGKAKEDLLGKLLATIQEAAAAQAKQHGSRPSAPPTAAPAPAQKKRAGKTLARP